MRVPLLKGRKLVICKWFYRTKYTSDGSVERHKAQCSILREVIWEVPNGNVVRYY